MKKINYACLFSGIGAPLQAAYRVYGIGNINHIFSCEYDKFARQSFSAIYDIDQDHFHNDVREMDGKQYRGKVDVLVGGSPCQAFSIAGLREGTEDERGQLIYQYIRIVEEVMAPVIVYENVKGMLSISGGRTIKEFVWALRDIGYFCHYDVVNTKDYGVPQNRERIFLVGFLDGEQYLRFRYAEKKKLEKRLMHVLEDDVEEKYYLSDEMVEKFVSKGNCEGYINQDTQASSVFSTEKESPSLCAGTHGYAQGYIFDKERINRAIRCGGNASMSDKHCFDLIGEPKILQIGRGFNDGGLHDNCPTITKNSFECNNFVQTNRIRKLTPLECWRLQDFPDAALHKAKEAGLSDSQLYKQAGNSMSVNVLEMIFKQIEASKFKDERRLF